MGKSTEKLDRCFLLLLVGVVFTSYIDRGNIGYAARDLCLELNLTHEEYGRAVSFFFAGYLLTQVVGNVLLKRLGAPVWISFIVFSWGCVATLMGLIQNTTQFYVLRFVLGVAEGGAFPAIWYTISLFYPLDHVTNAYSVIVSSSAFSMPISSPISAGLLSLGSYVGMKGWRLLFIVEGTVPMIYALFLYARLPVSPEKSSFLDAEEKKWIASKLDRCDTTSGLSFWQEVKTVAANPTWRLCSACGMSVAGISSVLMFWATLIIHDMLYGKDENEDEDSETCGSKNGNAVFAVLLTAIPFLVSGVVSLLPRYYTIRNRPHFSAIVYCIGGVAMIFLVVISDANFTLRLLCLVCTIAGEHLTGVYIIGMAITSCETSTRSVAASLFNMSCAFGAVIYPPVFGKLMDVYGPEVAMVISAGAYFVAALLILCVKDPLASKKSAANNAADNSNELC